MIGRITPEKITKLEPGQIFVFGSNQGGKHGKGAAKTALTWVLFGAKQMVYKVEHMEYLQRTSLLEEL
jgi:hypothetical protein